MRAHKFNNQLRPAFQALMAGMDRDFADASMGESIIKNLTHLTDAQQKLLHADLNNFLQYRVRSWNMAVMAERIANGHGWHV